MNTNTLLSENLERKRTHENDNSPRRNFWTNSEEKTLILFSETLGKTLGKSQINLSEYPLLIYFQTMMMALRNCQNQKTLAKLYHKKKLVKKKRGAKKMKNPKKIITRLKK